MKELTVVFLQGGMITVKAETVNVDPNVRVLMARKGDEQRFFPLDAVRNWKVESERIVN